MGGEGSEVDSALADVRPNHPDMVRARRRRTIARAPLVLLVLLAGAVVLGLIAAPFAYWRYEPLADGGRFGLAGILARPGAVELIRLHGSNPRAIVRADLRPGEGLWIPTAIENRGRWPVVVTGIEGFAAGRIMLRDRSLQHNEPFRPFTLAPRARQELAIGFGVASGCRLSPGSSGEPGLIRSKETMRVEAVTYTYRVGPFGRAKTMPLHDWIDLATESNCAFGHPPKMSRSLG